MTKDKEYDTMNLTARLPDGAFIDISVNNTTPMMDLLVKIATTYHLQPSAHYISAFPSKSSHEHQSHKSIAFTPNTPIGTLPVQFIQILPKSQLAGHHISTKSLYNNLSSVLHVHDNNYRLKIHLPRNQFYVMRVTPLSQVSEVFRKVCDDKSLDMNKYELQLSNNNQTLDQNLTLSDYGQVNEIRLVPKEMLNPSSFSTQEIISMKISSKSQSPPPLKSIKGQLLSSIFNKGQQNVSVNGNQSVLSSLSSSSTTDSRSDDCPLSTLSSQQSSEDLQSSAENLQKKSTNHQKKRRQAPKPPNPSLFDSEEAETIEKRALNHSRNSSDSSGYHETSISSDNYGTLPTLNEIQKNLLNMKIHSKSTSNLQSDSSKRKKPPPPPPVNKISQDDKTTLKSIDKNQQEFFGPKHFSLENLEKRRNLVLQRELTSLNNKIIHENNKSIAKEKSNNMSEYELKTSTLPNFSIRTYSDDIDTNKSNQISIYEDDSVHSNIKRRYNSVNNLTSDNECFSLKKTSDNRFALLNIRNDTSIKRSVSNAGLRPLNSTFGGGGGGVSNGAVWNDSDLQSLSVMRQILPKLHKEPENILEIGTWSDRTNSQNLRKSTDDVAVQVVDLKVKKQPQFTYNFTKKNFPSFGNKS